MNDQKKIRALKIQIEAERRKKELEQQVSRLKLEKEIKKKKREELRILELKKKIEDLKNGEYDEAEDIDLDSDAHAMELTGKIQKYSVDTHRNFSLSLDYEECATIRIAKTSFAEGTFRKAYFCKYSGIPALAVGKILKETKREKQDCELDLQALLIAHHFCDKFNSLDPPKKIRYTSVFLLKLDYPFMGAFYISIEERLPGKFIKFNNNSEYVNIKEKCRTAQAFSHFTHQSSKGSLMITDVQGAKLADNSFAFTDPAIHSTRGSFGGADRKDRGMKEFFENHECNHICLELKLKKSVYQLKADDHSETVFM